MKFRLKEKLIYLFLTALCWVFLVPPVASNQKIRVTIVPSRLAPQPGDTITVSINVDMSDITELLGGFNATLAWSPDTLRYLDYSGGTTEGFTNPIVNDQEALDGQIKFGNFNVQGKGGIVNILNVRYIVVSVTDSILSLNLEFSEMMAARTFVNLLPFIEIIITEVDVSHTLVGIPEGYELQQNYPNPFNTQTSICFTLPRSSHVYLAIYNILSQKLKTLINDPIAAGYHVVNWDGSDDNRKPVSSGIYIYQFKTGDFKSAMYMTIVK